MPGGNVRATAADLHNHPTIRMPQPVADRGAGPRTFAMETNMDDTLDGSGQAEHRDPAPVTAPPTEKRSLRPGETAANEPFRDLRSLCRAIDDEVGRGAETLERRILDKLGIYEAWAERHARTLEEASNGTLRLATIMRQIGHTSIKRTTAVQAALEAMAERFLASAPTRHDPETAIDLQIDAYEVILDERGYGPPLFAKDSRFVAHRAAAADIGCAPEDLDGTALRRLLLIRRGMPDGIVDNGRITKRDGWQANPAVAPLVTAGLVRLGALPEDPLFPGRPDLITIAEESGVAVDDILQDHSIRAEIHSALIAAKPIPNPFIAIRRYTWRDLMESGREAATAAYNAVQARKPVHALRGFMGLEGKEFGEDDLVPYDFKERVERAINEDYRRFDAGWRRWMKDWIGWNDDLRASMPLPASLGLKLRILFLEVGLTVAEAARRLKGLHGYLPNWVDGRAVPMVAGEAKLEALAIMLRTPLAVIKRDLRDEFRVRAFALKELGYSSTGGKRLPFDFETRYDEAERKAILEANLWRYDKQDTAYSRRLPSLIAAQYRMKHDDWPVETKQAWEDNWPKADKRSSLRKVGDQQRRERKADGKLKMDPKKIRDTTMRIHRDQLDFVFGYLHTSRQQGSPPGTPRSPTDYVAEGGLGIPKHLIKVALLALPDLITAFTGYRARRAGSTNRAVTLALKGILTVLIPEHGIVWRSPDMLADLEEFVAWWNDNPMAVDQEDFFFDIEAFRDDWQGAVEHTYNLIRDDIEAIQQEHADDEEFEPSRNAFNSVRVYIDHDRPMELYMVSVRAMLAARPTGIIQRHVHTRDCVNALVLVQTGLRTYNMLFTYDAGDGGPVKRKRGRNGQVLEPTIRKVEKDGETKWVVKIPSSEFKNFYSPYFKGRRPYEHVLADEDGLYDYLEEYTTKSRFYLLRGRKSDAFFVTAEGNDMTEAYAGDNYRRLTSMYFIYNPDLKVGGVEGAMPHGMHSVRNVRATHVVKVTGNLHLAAWSIQDQVRTIERHYAEFVPADKVKLAEQVLAEARAAGRAAHA